MAEPRSELDILGVQRGSLSESILRLILELSVRFIKADEGSLLVFDPKSKDLVFAMTSGSAASEKVLIGQHVPLGKGLTGLAAVTREVQTGSPTYKDVHMAERLKDGGEREPEAVIAAPMLLHDELIGVITAVTFEHDRRFTVEDAHLYAHVASIAGVIVGQNARLYGSEPAVGALATIEVEREIADLIRAIARGQPERLAAVRDVLRSLVTLC